MKKILDYLTEEQLRLFKKVFLKKDEVLFYEKDLCTSVGFVQTGEIEILSYLENGQEVIYNEIKAGQIFGNNLIFSSEPFYRGDVRAKEETMVLLIDKNNLKKILKDNDEFLEAYLKAQSDFGKSLNLKIKLLTFNNAKDRLEFYLSINKGIIKYKSITDLAQILNLSREVLSRSIHKLAKSGEIKIGCKTIEKQN